MTKLFIGVLVAVAVVAGGNGYLVNAIGTDNDHARAQVATITALRAEVKFWETAADQENGELHELQAKP